MTTIRFLNGFSRLVMAPDEGGSGGGAAAAPVAGAPATAKADTNSNASASATAGTTAGQAATASGEQISASATVAAGVGTEAEKTDTGDFRAAWPDELKNDPSLKDFKDTASIAKALSETKKLIGQKLGIPGPDATPEAKAAFFEAMGVPKEPAGYGFEPPTDIPEALKEHYDAKHAEKWAGIFQKHNVPKEAANALRAELFKEITAEIGDMQVAADRSEEEFGKAAASIYGDNAKATQALTNVRTMVEKHVPASLKAGMDQLSNTALLIMAATIRGETMQLSGEDKTISQIQGDTGGQSEGQLREEARRLMALPEYNSAFTPKGKAGHEEVTKQVKDIYAKINAVKR